MTTIILAHITFSISYVVVVVRGRLATMGTDLEEAALDLGATPWQAVRLVTLPALWPAILAAAMIVFALSFDDFVLSFFTTGETPQPLPVRIYSALRFGISPTINAVGTLMMLVSAAPHRPGRGAAAAARAARERHGGPDRGGATMTGCGRARAASRSASATFTAVDALDLQVGQGEFFSLLGPSGCGKTTTLRLIAGFEQPTEGAIRLDGEDVATVPPYRRNVNTVFQSYALFDHLDVEENVAFGLRRRKVAEAGDRSSAWRRRSSSSRSHERATRAAGRALGRPAPARRARPRARQPAVACCCSTSRSARSTSSCASRCRSSSSASSARSGSRSST